MKLSEIKLQAESIIKDLFSVLDNNDNKEDWQKAIYFIVTKTESYEAIGGENKFIWRKVRSIMTNKYGKKFIK